MWWIYNRGMILKAPWGRAGGPWRVLCFVQLGIVLAARHTPSVWKSCGQRQSPFGIIDLIIMELLHPTWNDLPRCFIHMGTASVGGTGMPRLRWPLELAM